MYSWPFCYTVFLYNNYCYILINGLFRFNTHVPHKVRHQASNVSNWSRVKQTQTDISDENMHVSNSYDTTITVQQLTVNHPDEVYMQVTAVTLMLIFSLLNYMEEYFQRVKRLPVWNEQTQWCETAADTDTSSWCFVTHRSHWIIHITNTSKTRVLWNWQLM